MTRDHVSGHIDFIELPAKDEATLARSKAFFHAAFGWGYEDWGSDYADIQQAGIGAGLNADPAHRPRAPLVIVYVDDLEAAQDRITAAGGTISRDLFSFPGGRRFHFVDPSGNELAVWSDRPG